MEESKSIVMRLDNFDRFSWSLLEAEDWSNFMGEVVWDCSGLNEQIRNTFEAMRAVVASVLGSDPEVVDAGFCKYAAKAAMSYEETRQYRLRFHISEEENGVLIKFGVQCWHVALDMIWDQDAWSWFISFPPSMMNCFKGGQLPIFDCSHGPAPTDWEETRESPQ